MIVSLFNSINQFYLNQIIRKGWRMSHINKFGGTNAINSPFI
jgi:hypothetical protein